MDPRIPLGPSFPGVETRRRPVRVMHSSAGKPLDMRDVYVDGKWKGEVVEVERDGQTGWLPIGVRDLAEIDLQPTLTVAVAMVVQHGRAWRRPPGTPTPSSPATRSSSIIMPVDPTDADHVSGSHQLADLLASGNPIYVYITQHETSPDPIPFADRPTRLYFKLRHAFMVSGQGKEAVPNVFRSLDDVHDFLDTDERNWVLVEEHDVKVERQTVVTYKVWCRNCPFEFEDPNRDTALAMEAQHKAINHRGEED